MSGGHFDYAYTRLEEMADKLEQELRGDNGRSFSSETLQRLRRCEVFLHHASQIAHDVEWLFSGDYGEETFAQKMDEYLPSSSSSAKNTSSSIRLIRWGKLLQEENNSLGDTLVKYAQEWEEELKAKDTLNL